MTNSSGCKAVATARGHGGKMEGVKFEVRIFMSLKSHDCITLPRPAT